VRRLVFASGVFRVPGTGHGVLADKPELCNWLIVEFLTETRKDADR
jgi:pimeloyl-ACP methyl ester carboxylesterase